MVLEGSMEVSLEQILEVENGEAILKPVLHQMVVADVVKSLVV